MKRLGFTLVFCGTWAALDVAAWGLGFGFDFEGTLAAIIIVTSCALLMPDHES